MAHIDRYLQLAVTKRASDIHFTSNEPVRMRVDGDLEVVEPNVLDPNHLTQLIFEILTEDERRKFADHRNLDKSYSLAGVGNFRVNTFMTRRGIAAVLRTIPSKIPQMTDLGLPEVVTSLTELSKGLVLVTGPTGSGKSTTLAAMLHHINCTFPYHILTAEDPVEFVHESRKSLVNQREIGSSCPSFSDALKYALREDPDVILVGEMRDLETIGLALTAAETGHLVFGTLHTRGAPAAIDRIIDSFPGNQQSMIRTMLSESLAAVISQALLKRADGGGRIAAYEIMIVNHAIANLIREGKTFQVKSIIQTAKKEGMMLMDQHIRDLVSAGLVTKDEANLYLEEPVTIGGKSRPGSSSAGPTKSTSMPVPRPTGASNAAPPSISAPPRLSKPPPIAAAPPMAKVPPPPISSIGAVPPPTSLSSAGVVPTPAPAPPISPALPSPLGGGTTSPPLTSGMMPLPPPTPIPVPAVPSVVASPPPVSGASLPPPPSAKLPGGFAPLTLNEEPRKKGREVRVPPPPPSPSAKPPGKGLPGPLLTDLTAPRSPEKNGEADDMDLPPGVVSLDLSEEDLSGENEDLNQVIEITPTQKKAK